MKRCGMDRHVSVHIYSMFILKLVAHDRCLTNIAAGSFEQTEAVISAMPRLIQILSSDVEAVSIKEQVCWTIGNIAGECDEFRATLLANGCLGPLHRCCCGAVASARAEV